MDEVIDAVEDEIKPSNNACDSLADSRHIDLFSKALRNNQATSLNRVKPEQVALGMRKVEGLGRGTVINNGREMLNLASNNYLGLAGDERIKEAGIKALRDWGNSTSGSRMLNGTNDLHIELEEQLKAFKKADALVSFQSGYMANLGVISALTGKDDVVIVDKLVHASVIDGVRLSGAKVRMFPHQNLESLERLLKCMDNDAGKLVVVDGIYSMDGDFARLPEIIKISHRYGARVMVDDAHATGVAGDEGRGTSNHFGINDADIVTGTLSKAFGCVGGFVSCKEDIAEFIKYNARAFIYSTSLSPSVTASLLRASGIILDEPERRENLWACTNHLLEGLKDMGYNTGVSETPIIPVILDDMDTMFDLVRRLDDDKIFASPVIYPACPVKQPRVRISLCSDHTVDDMDCVLYSFYRHGVELGLLN